MTAQGQATGEVRHAIDATKLEKFIQTKSQGAEPGLSFQPPLTLKQFKTGQSNPTYLITDARGNKYVLRKKPPGKLLSKKAHAVEREYAVLSKLRDHGGFLQVPKVYHLCDDPNVLGTPFYLMEFVQGRIFTNVKLPGLTDEEKKEIWLSSIKALSNLHKVDIHKAQLEEYGIKGNFFSRQLKGLLKLSDIQSKTPNIAKLYRAEDMEKIFSENPIKDEVFNQGSNDVLGVLDWELSTIGHPLFDLANLLQPFYTKNLFKVLKEEEHLNLSAFYSLEDDPTLPKNFVEELLKSYCKLTNRTYPIANWNVCVAFSFFRLAVISQGVAARFARGQASSENAKEFIDSTSIAKLIFDLLPPKLSPNL